MISTIERSAWITIEDHRAHRTSLPRLADIVPQPDDRLLATFVLEAERADTGQATEERASGAMPCQRHVLGFRLRADILEW